MTMKELYGKCEERWAIGTHYENEGHVCGSECEYFETCCKADDTISHLEGLSNKTFFPICTNKDYELLVKYSNIEI